MDAFFLDGSWTENVPVVEQCIKPDGTKGWRRVPLPMTKTAAEETAKRYSESGN